jgi:hypothetical protein
MRKVRTSRKFGRKAKPNKHGITEFEVAKLELHDGDILVLRTDLYLDAEQLQVLRDRAKEQFPGIKCVVLSAGLSLAVLQDKRRAA